MISTPYIPDHSRPFRLVEEVILITSSFDEANYNSILFEIILNIVENIRRKILKLFTSKSLLLINIAKNFLEV